MRYWMVDRLILKGDKPAPNHACELSIRYCSEQTEWWQGTVFTRTGEEKSANRGVLLGQYNIIHSILGDFPEKCPNGQNISSFLIPDELMVEATVETIWDSDFRVKKATPIMVANNKMYVAVP